MISYTILLKNQIQNETCILAQDVKISRQQQQQNIKATLEFFLNYVLLTLILQKLGISIMYFHLLRIFKK